MKIYQGVEDFQKLKYAVVTSGTFDGVHVGHQTILSRLKEMAQNAGGETVLITFWPHPRFILNPDDDSIKLLTTFEEKTNLLKMLGIDHLVTIPFTKSFSQMSSEDFIKQILINKINTKKLIIGYDHRFGKNREGSFDHLVANASTYGFEVIEISRQDVDDVTVSSTKIRKALEQGEIEIANEFLGRPYTISGIVIPGDRRGRIIGFPTANVYVKEKYKLIPDDGIYAVKVIHQGEEYNGMLNIGFRPTFGGQDKTIEVNIFNFKKEIYQQNLTLHLISKIRNEIRFNNAEELKNQLLKDKEEVNKILFPEV
ncbi:MAG: bifunctional riboflavin kinase/FAD synthetase [Bacteroidota bacterium]|nr:bifunctional riboflavin kinase/FAD synthetase [Bacteroidota bacterium]